MHESSPKFPPSASESGWAFDNSYARLPEYFYARVNPQPVPSPRLAVFNRALATKLGLDISILETEKGESIFSGNKIPDGAAPIAQAYVGHQFGHFTMLGDGRAILLGEQITPKRERFDIQLKGSGQTPFSRRGDGRAALGPMLREYIISEAMHALGVPTTRSLAVVITGEQIYRESPLPGAILTRVAASHIRVGTFEYAATKPDQEAIRLLADHTIQRHYPELRSSDSPYLGLLRAVMDRQAALLAKWMHVGFVHGVMNTDNMAVSGETIDYGPCAFMDEYSPVTLFSSIDHNGRYAYGNQPRIAEWNLARFAETLIPLLHKDQEQAVALATEALGTFSAVFQKYWRSGMQAKLGLFSEEPEDADLVKSLLQWMEKLRADYTNTFRALSATKIPEEPLFRDPAFLDWHSRWQSRLQRQSETKEASLRLMLSANPDIIPRNHRVEEALAAATEHGDFSVMHELLAALQNPYENSAAHEKYRAPSEPGDVPYQTFCGT